MDSQNRSPAALAADVLIAYLERNNVVASDLPALAQRLCEAFASDALAPCNCKPENRNAQEASPALEVPSSDTSKRPACSGISIAESITDEYLISMEDGKHYKSLRRHLMAKYGMTPDDYRAKWGLPADYPMVAPAYARSRSEVAKRIGLGRTSGNRALPDARRA